MSNFFLTPASIHETIICHNPDCCHNTPELDMYKVRYLGHDVYVTRDGDEYNVKIDDEYNYQIGLTYAEMIAYVNRMCE